MDSVVFNIQKRRSCELISTVLKKFEDAVVELSGRKRRKECGTRRKLKGWLGCW